jgi:hypothetical protein
VADVCFNGCSGHGTCNDFACSCFIGFFGDDCRNTFVQDTSNIVPILGAGHFNLTLNNFSSLVSKKGLSLVGFSSRKVISSSRENFSYLAMLFDFCVYIVVPQVHHS